MGVREPVLRKDMEAEGAKAISLRWIDTDQSAGFNWSCERSKSPSRNPRFLPPLNSSSSGLSLCSSSHGEAKGKNSGNVRRQSCALPRGTIAKIVRGTPRRRERTTCEWEGVRPVRVCCLTEKIHVRHSGREYGKGPRACCVRSTMVCVLGHLLQMEAL